jgi:hypothetical protein
VTRYSFGLLYGYFEQAGTGFTFLFKINRMGRIFLIILLHQAFYLPAQTLDRPVAANFAGTEVYSKRHAAALSGMVNQASLAGFNNFRAVLYAEKRYLLREWQQMQVAASMPLQSGQFGMQLMYRGSAGYKETKAGLAYARNLGNKLDAGVQFNYHGIGMGSIYGTASAISFEAGMILHLSDKVHAGAHVNNPAGGKWSKSGTGKLPAVYSFGIGYDASAVFFTGLEIVKEEDQPVSIQAGFLYQPLPLIRIRAGVATATASAWMALGLQKKGWGLDITAACHPQLGISPGIILTVSGK